MSKAHVGFRVHQYNPWRWWLGVGLVLLLLAGMFLLGRIYQSQELSQLRFDLEIMGGRAAELENRNADLVKRNALLQETSKIEHDAYEKSRLSQLKLQNSLLELKEQLVFYQGIVSPEQLTLGINLQSFDLNKKNDNGLYSYKLVLSKRGKSDQFVKGDFDLVVKGVQDEQQIDFVLKQLKPDYAEKDVEYSFRYFQVLDGDLLLPDQFEPYDIELTFNPTTKKIKSFSETISWAQAVSGGND